MIKWSDIQADTCFMVTPYHLTIMAQLAATVPMIVQYKKQPFAVLAPMKFLAAKNYAKLGVTTVAESRIGPVVNNILSEAISDGLLLQQPRLIRYHMGVENPTSFPPPYRFFMVNIKAGLVFDVYEQPLPTTTSNTTANLKNMRRAARNLLETNAGI